MKSRKIDRRVSRTRRALRSAFLELIDEKGYDAVTVEELTDRANLGRTTFYLHYKDKEDMLLEQFRELIDRLFDQLAEIPLSSWRLYGVTGNPKPGPVRPILMIFQHAAENARLYRIVLRGEGAFTATERLREIITIAIEEFLHIKTTSEGVRLKTLVPLEVFSNYFAGSLLGILTWWLGQEMPYSPEQMTGMFQNMFLPGARHVLDIDGQD